MEHGRPTRLELHGEYDIWRQQELRDAFATIGGSATIDLSEVTYGDSIFLQKLIRMRKRLDGATVTLTGADPNIKRLLLISGFDKVVSDR